MGKTGDEASREPVGLLQAGNVGLGPRQGEER